MIQHVLCISGLLVRVVKYFLGKYMATIIIPTCAHRPKALLQAHANLRRATVGRHNGYCKLHGTWCRTARSCAEHTFRCFTACA